MRADHDYPKDDPYGDNRPYHFIDKMREDGRVHAICTPTLRPLPLRSRWTTRKEAVTCGKCLRLMHNFREMGDGTKASEESKP